MQSTQDTLLLEKAIQGFKNIVKDFENQVFLLELAKRAMTSYKSSYPSTIIYPTKRVSKRAHFK